MLPNLYVINHDKLGWAVYVFINRQHTWKRVTRWYNLYDRLERFALEPNSLYLAHVEPRKYSDFTVYVCKRFK